MAERCVTVRRHRPVQLQHFRRDDSVAQLVSARPADLGAKHRRFDPVSGVRIPGIHRDLSCPLGLAAKEHFLVGCLHGLLGCVGFMISALFAISFPTEHPEAITISIAFTLLGAIGFLVSSLLMLPETVSAS